MVTVAPVRLKDRRAPSAYRRVGVPAYGRGEAAVRPVHAGWLKEHMSPIGPIRGTP